MQPIVRVRLGVAGTLLAMAAIGVQAMSAPALAKAPRVAVQLDLDQVVQPFSASYVASGIRSAEASHAAVVLLRIDTPGGLDHSMRRIISAILSARVPIVCWVGPSGARAASAGTFILEACPYAVMAPGTNVGAAHPVGVQGQIMSEKVTNDAAAFIRSLAQERGRNVDWSERAVRQAVSASAEEALRLHVIDGIASSPSGALSAANGHPVRLGNGTTELVSWPISRIAHNGMPLVLGLLGSLVDPNIAFVLFLVGIVGIIFEILHPGLSLPGILGILAFVLALVEFETMPVNIAGIVLLVAGIVFLVVELHVPGHGLSALAGVVALIFGGLFLFDAGSLVRVSRPLLVGVVLAKALLILVVMRKVLAARRLPKPVHTMVGAEGVATSDLNPQGTVRVRSEEWTAESTAGRIKAGTKVTVVDEKGLRLRVDRVSEGEASKR